MQAARTILAAMFLITSMIGCDQGSSNGAPAAATTSSSPSPSTPGEGRAEGHASIHGTVHFQGTPPTMAALPGATCMDSHSPILDESVLVSKSLTIKNAVVYLENAPASPAPSKPAILDQVNCTYVPHVLAMQTNQPLTIRTSDATFHNVHYGPDINPPNNFSLTSAGQESTVTFKSPEFIKFRCDVHPWMSAWAAVFDHPFFAVTSEAGSYEIKSVPAGTYKLVCWHERLGRQEQELTVVDQQIAQADFVYKAPN